MYEFVPSQIFYFKNSKATSTKPNI
jgi:hypothetical protein